MKVYLVGGAVRDQLLGYPVKERDFVVVGGSKEALLKQGYTQVGQDFPVFLHPKTKEEYALARMERKTARGYYGFECDFSPKVTLFEDLARRDLTINAMAIDDKGNLIDPYHGLCDLKARKLRHISPAFVEDPVRVLRVARFVARYDHLGFTLADETRCLMAEMVRDGELHYLVPERVWQEFAKSLLEKNPEKFITTLRSCGALSVIFPELDGLFGIPNRTFETSCMDSGIQALQALGNTAQQSSDSISRFAALMYTIGNRKTPIVAWPYHPLFPDAIGECLQAIGRRLCVPKAYLKLAGLIASFYRALLYLQKLSAHEIVQVLERCDAFRRPELFLQLLEVFTAIAGKEGRACRLEWQELYEHCQGVHSRVLIEKGLVGEAIKKGLYEERIRRVTMWKNQHEK